VITHPAPDAGVRLELSTEADFDWLLGGSGAGRWQVPPDGLEAPSALKIIRNLHRRAREATGSGAWFIVVGDEAVGLCGYFGAPDAAGAVEIGYNIAVSRQRRGYAKAAVAAVVEAARADPRLTALIAQVADANAPSHAVLKANGFEPIGTSYDPHDGPLIRYRRDVSASAR
jgi:RimJ/RimL family protein N-acetyltransferase